MWKPLFEYEGFYEAHPDGFVRRVGAKKKLAISISNGGYARVHLSKDGVKKKVLLHRAIAKTFLFKNYVKGFDCEVINHIDGNPLNNKVGNLEWVTQSQNVKHSFSILNRRNSRAKYVLNIETGIFYDTIKEAAITTNYSYQSIRFKLTGRWPNNTSLVLSS